jgi:hypothetical protein
MHDACLKGGQGDVSRMRQHIIPVGECRRRNRIRRNVEALKSPAQQVASQGSNRQYQNDGRDPQFLKQSHLIR